MDVELDRFAPMTSPPPALARSSFATADPLEAREVCDVVFGSRLRVGAAGTFDLLRLDRVQAGPFELGAVTIPLDVVADNAGQDRWVFGTLTRGEVYRADGSRHATGDTYIGMRPGREEVVRVLRCRAETVTLPSEVILEATGQLPEYAGVPDFLGDLPIATRVAQWRRTVRHVRELLEGLDGTTAPLMIGSASRLLAATALYTFPNTATAVPGRQDARDGHPRTLRRAIAFIDANADLDITLSDIARAADVTPRAVQLAFRRHLDTTPLDHLRRVRLDSARAELLAARPGDGTTVTRTALDWGFANPGRFSQRYRAAFGELPHETLARTAGPMGDDGLEPPTSSV